MEFRRRLCKTEMRSKHGKENTEPNRTEPNRRWKPKENSKTSYATITQENVLHKANERYLYIANRYKIASNKTETIFYCLCCTKFNFICSLYSFAHLLTHTLTSIRCFVFIHLARRHSLVSLSLSRYKIINYIICMLIL